MNEGKRRIYRISELTRLLKSTLENAFGELWIEGEISNFRQPSSGHFYFTVKDESAQIGAVMFRGSQHALKFQPKDGLLVQAFGQITVYERSGVYQIVVKQMEQAGKGSLQAAFEALKKKLAAEGLFDASRKKALPLFPQHIGIVTSPTGAAIRDILKVVSRRFPNLHIVLAPVRVQGEGAAREIAAAIELFNRLAGVDVMIVGRGGGSLEDLWCFNEEVVARAIAASGIPIISAVGHETDFTISDFVADVRAPTPSAAAEIVIDRKEVLESRIAEAARRLARGLREGLRDAKNRLAAARKSYVFAEPSNLAKRARQRVAELRLRIQHRSANALRESQQRADDAGLRISHRLRMATQAARQDVKRLEILLKALNPSAVILRGYSITRDDRWSIVRDAATLREGQRVFTEVAAGAFASEVIGTTAGGQKRAATCAATEDPGIGTGRTVGAIPEER